MQILPQINIPSSFVVQRILEFSINQKGNTELSYKADRPNVSFVEIVSSKMDSAANDINYVSTEKPTVQNIQEGIKWVQSRDEDNIPKTSTREER